MIRALVLVAAAQACCVAVDLTGNWVARDPLPDGTVRRTYFDLKQDGSRITGHIRATQFYYEIKESSGGPEGFTLNASMLDGNTTRTAKYEGKLEGDQLHVTTRRRPDAPLTRLVAHRAPAGEGAMPARLPLPALHIVRSKWIGEDPAYGLE
jgi:alpha-galactosidase